MKKLLTFTALGTVLLASGADAAGFHLREQSIAAQGNAFAGATAGAENNSYSYYNAAGLTRQKGTQVNVGATYVDPTSSAGNVIDATNNREPDVDNIVHAAWIPNGTISHQVNDKTFVGLGMNIPFGMVTKYDQDWVGSDHGITSKVSTTTITPMVAYKLTNKLSVGAGLPIQYIKARLTNTSTSGLGVANTALEGDTLDVGYQLSALYEMSEDTRFGVNYRSQINHKIKGEIESDNAHSLLSPLVNQDINATLDAPAMLSFGAYHQLNEKWAIMAEYQRVFWSSFKSLDIYGDSYQRGNPLPAAGGGLVSHTKENWRDTDFFALGASYQMDEQWKLRLGWAYDQAAAREADLTPRIPDSDRTWYSVGLNYEYNENLTFDAAYTYIEAKDATVSMNEFSADYENSVKLFGLSMNYKF